jgi:phosphoserine phosphatase
VPECIEGIFTGKTVGTLNLREGKVINLKAWLLQQGLSLENIISYGYSDSINDLPLLECVNHAVAVHPDEKLALIAQEKNWPILSLY